jgi:type VI secretion system protein
MRRTFLLRTAGLGVAAAALAGCGTVGKVMNLVGLGGTRLAWKEVVIAASESANQNTAVAVDIVLVLEDEAVAKLAALPAAKWFQTRSEMLRTYPGSFAYKSWEVAPGQRLSVPGSHFGSPSVVGVFVFADYLAPGEHRMKVEQLSGGIMVELGARGFTVSPVKAN